VNNINFAHIIFPLLPQADSGAPRQAALLVWQAAPFPLIAEKTVIKSTPAASYAKMRSIGNLLRRADKIWPQFTIRYGIVLQFQLRFKPGCADEIFISCFCATVLAYSNISSSTLRSHPPKIGSQNPYLILLLSSPIIPKKIKNFFDKKKFLLHLIFQNQLFCWN
jgi:hypothetical protein